MIEFDFAPHGVCSRNISKLVEGQPVQQIVDLLAGNTCGPRPTSCADQMTLALKEAVAKANA